MCTVQCEVCTVQRRAGGGGGGVDAPGRVDVSFSPQVLFCVARSAAVFAYMFGHQFCTLRENAYFRSLAMSHPRRSVV